MIVPPVRSALVKLMYLFAPIFSFQVVPYCLAIRIISVLTPAARYRLPVWELPIFFRIKWYDRMFYSDNLVL